MFARTLKNENCILFILSGYFVHLTEDESHFFLSRPPFYCSFRNQFTSLFKKYPRNLSLHHHTSGLNQTLLDSFLLVLALTQCPEYKFCLSSSFILLKMLLCLMKCCSLGSSSSVSAKGHFVRSCCCCLSSFQLHHWLGLNT